MPLVRQDQLRAIFPKASPTLLAAFNDHWLGLAEINTVPRLRYLLAQVGHESMGLTVLEENLNYSWAGLYKTFPKYFTSSTAKNYARQPERIANRVYAGRMGNGPESSGDGWRYRGRGVIQLTGKSNYQAVAKRFPEIDCVADPHEIKTPDGAMAALVTFWLDNNCNRYADERDFVGLTKRINGGTNGLQDRYRWRAIVEAVI
jgi:putative chitinase